MDTITQGLLGGAVGQAIFGRKLGGRASILAALAAMAPDLDVVIQSSTDPMVAWKFHRHFTHSLVFVPIGALIATGLLYWLWRGRMSFRTAWLVATVGYLTHAPLDICTSYGTQYWWPFTDARVSIDWISIIDLAYTLPLLIGWTWGLVRRSARPAAIGFAVSTLYLLFGGWQHHRAAEVQDRLAAARGHTLERSRVMPTPFNLLVWRSIYETDGRYYADAIRVSPLSDPMIWEGDSVEKATAEHLTATFPRSAPQWQDVWTFSWFTSGWIYRHPADRTVIGDFRYSMVADSTASLWGIRLFPDDLGRHVERAFFRRDTDNAVDRLWQMITRSGGQTLD